MILSRTFARVATKRKNSRMRLHALLALLSCMSGSLPVVAQAPVTAPRAPATQAVPGNFADITAKSHVSFEGQASHTARKYLLETMGSGVALFDYDNDGLLDIFFVNGA